LLYIRISFSEDGKQIFSYICGLFSKSKILMALKIGITIGDINGIGPEVIIKALGNPNILKTFTPVIYGSYKVLSYHKNIVKDINDQFSFSPAMPSKPFPVK
jgi:hypothetical protein